MLVVKSILILVFVLAQRYALSPPNARPPTEQIREQRGLSRALPRLTMLVPISCTLWGLFELALLFALSEYCPPVLARLLRDALPATLFSDPTAITALTPTFLAGMGLTIAGALLRAHCFGALGTRFTFELAIRPTHTLVTDGVYGVVRHPSYTGSFALILGLLLCMFDRSRWVGGVCATAGKIAHPLGPLLGTAGVLPGADDGRCSAMVTGVLACVWVSVSGLTCAALHERMNKEDAMLENTFGDSWRAWAGKVPCRVVPGVY